MKSVATLAVSAAVMMAGLSMGCAENIAEKVSPGSDRKDVAVTIYNESLALVRETRSLDFGKGINRFALRDVSGLIRPETASMVGTSGGKFQLLEQNFDFDLLTPNALLDKYVGQEVTIVTYNAEKDSESRETAKLLSNNGGIVLQYKDRIETGLPQGARIQYASVPKNLRDRPTLVADVMSETTGTQTVGLSYLTGGFGWKADYVAELNADETSVSLAGWVTLTNNSGTEYQNAKLQLVAGDVNIAYDAVMADSIRERAVIQQAAMPKMQQENLFEYHLYTLARPTTLKDKQTKQVALLNADKVPVKKIYRMQGGSSYAYRHQGNGLVAKRDIEVYVSFANEKENNLGIPLPKGIVRVYKPDSAGNALFIGEDKIDHIADKQSATLKLGNAFDVNGTWNRTGFKKISDDVYEVSVEIELSNAKDIPVEVEVLEPVQDNWEMLAETFKHKKESANMAGWKITVAPKDKTVLQYTVRVRT